MGMSRNMRGLPLIWKQAPITISDISDAGVEGAALLATATPAAARTALGLSDITNELTAAMARASALCGFAKTPKVWTFDSVAQPGNLGSRWTALGLVPATITNVTAAGTVGGVIEIDTTAAANKDVQLISVANGLGIFGGALMPDLVAAPSKWYLRVYMKITSTPDATTEMLVGFVNPGGSKIMGVGVQGSVDPTLFRAFRSGSVGVSSTIGVDGNWHLIEAFGNGDTNLYLAVDSEAARALAGMAWGDVAAPYAHFANGATGASQKCQLSTGYYITEGPV